MTTPVTSPVVQALGDAIAAAMTGGLSDVQVLDGADPMQGYAEKSVTVGGTWDAEAQSFVTDETLAVTVAESGAARRQTETTLLRCVAYAGSGDLDLAVHRATVGAILAAVRAAVRSITAIGGASARVQVVEESWAQGADDKGGLVLAPFTVQAVRLL